MRSVGKEGGQEVEIEDALDEFQDNFADDLVLEESDREDGDDEYEIPDLDDDGGDGSGDTDENASDGEGQSQFQSARKLTLADVLSLVRATFSFSAQSLTFI